MLAKTIMVQGTASSVGKSLMVTALCRILQRHGHRVAPFKAQNMSLNAAVTPDGLEIGRAQAVQAEASRITARVEMNPILLKPETDTRCQVVLMGKLIGTTNAIDYERYKDQARGVIAESLLRLRQEYEVVVIEGAGSPAEINLKARDIVNMHVAKLADAPVLLVGDIDRGGVFASLVGTLELLDPDERARIAALLVNKFRGDARLLDSGLEFLEARTGKPVLGVVPYLHDLRIADEDSVALEARAHRPRPADNELDIIVVRLPHIANYDDVLELEHAPGVRVRFVTDPAQLVNADLVIVPGSKHTLSDLAWLRDMQLAQALQARATQRAPILGICGGCQMLGESIEDPEGIESSGASVQGLGLLPLRTRFERVKRTAQVRARTSGRSFLTPSQGVEIDGYEIHMGVTQPSQGAVSPFVITSRNGQRDQARDGAVNAAGCVVGTMLHGLFDNAALCNGMLAGLRARRGLPKPADTVRTPSKHAEYDRLADAVEQHIDMPLLWRLLDLRPA